MARSEKPRRDTTFRKGNTAALKHGLRSRKAQLGLLPGQEEIRAVLAGRRARLTDDQGGPDAIGLVLEDTIDRYQRLWVLASTLEARIEREGILSGKGRTRASVTLYLGLIDRLTRLSQQLGFTRTAKHVPDLQDFLRQHEHEGAK